MFEVVDLGPGFDVGAHLHRNAEELFYVLEGQLDLLAFEPRVRLPPILHGHAVMVTALPL